MNISFKKDINKSLMVIEKVPGFSANDFMMKMLTGNEIAGLLPIGYENYNGQYNLLYDISSRQAFSKIFETRKLSFKQVKALIFSLKGILRSLEEYLLDANNIIFKQECIFADPDGEKYEFCYYPYYHGDLVLEIRELFTRMLSMVNYDDEKAVRLVYEVQSEVQRENFTIDNIVQAYSRVNQESSLKVQEEEVQEFLDYYDRNIDREFPDPGPCRANAQAADLPQEEEEPFFARFRSYVKGKKFMDVLEDINNGEFREKVRQSGKAPEEETAWKPEEAVFRPRKPVLESVELGDPLFDDAGRSSYRHFSAGRFESALAEDNPYLKGSGEGTATLGRDDSPYHKLVGRKSQLGVRYVIARLPFSIGKEEGFEGACIDEPTVSRMHARIYGERDGFYIEDLNSMNGTYLNDERLSAYTKTRLHAGDILRFAAEEFCFQ